MSLSSSGQDAAGQTPRFMVFPRIGIPVTCINLLVNALTLRWLN
jgi:hypothetical protein